VKKSKSAVIEIFMILFVDVGGRLYHFSPVENAESEILWTITLIKDKMGSKNDRAEWIKTLGTCVTLMIKIIRDLG
jgi:hypothetical protein